MRRYAERGFWCCRLEVCTEVGCLHRRLLDGIQWRIVEQLFRERQRRYYGGVALQVLKSRGRDDLAAVVPAITGTDNPRLWNIGPRLCAEDGGESVQGQRCEGVRERLGLDLRTACLSDADRGRRLLVLSGHDRR